jgi:hypothetical protein
MLVTCEFLRPAPSLLRDGDHAIAGTFKPERSTRATLRSPHLAKSGPTITVASKLAGTELTPR